VGDDEVCQRGVEDAGGIKLLARDGSTDDRKDAGADDSAYAERGQRPRAEGLFQGVFGFFRVPDELVDRLAGKQLAGQGSRPLPMEISSLSVQTLGGHRPGESQADAPFCLAARKPSAWTGRVPPS